MTFESEILKKIRKYSKATILESYNFLIDKSVELSGYDKEYFFKTREKEAIKYKFSIWIIIRKFYNCSYPYIAKMAERDYATVRHGILTMENILKYPNSAFEFFKTYKLLLTIFENFLDDNKFEDFKMIITEYSKIEKWLIDNKIKKNDRFKLLASLNKIEIEH